MRRGREARGIKQVKLPFHGKKHEGNRARSPLGWGGELKKGREI